MQSPKMLLLPRNLRRAWLCLSCAAVSPGLLAAQNLAALRTRVANIVAAHTDSGGPGAFVAIVHRGTPVVMHAVGAANLEDHTPVTPDSRVYLGSLAKQFTAASIALLVGDGKLALGDSVGHFVPGLPAEVAAIPISHLLHHRSGIRDYLKIRDLNGDRVEPFDNAEAVDIIRRQRSLVFPPGSRYQYSNSNYILLAEVVRAAVGVSLAEFARERVFEPAGMTSTHFETDATAIVPDRVTSYRRDDAGEWHRYIKQFDAIGDGGVWASGRDLLRWDALLRTRTVLPQPVFDILLTPPRDAGTPYAGGLLIRPFLGEPAIEHGGFMFGYQHHYLRFTGPDLAILILTSSREIDSFSLREQIARAAFEELTGRSLAKAPPAAAPAPSNAALAPTVELQPLDERIGGEFENDEIPLRITLAVDDGTLFIHPATFRRVAMARTGGQTFTALGGEISVRLGDTADEWTLAVRDLGEFRFVRVSGGGKLLPRE